MVDMCGVHEPQMVRCVLRVQQDLSSQLRDRTTKHGTGVTDDYEGEDYGDGGGERGARVPRDWGKLRPCNKLSNAWRICCDVAGRQMGMDADVL